jgi:hypothetical protein
METIARVLGLPFHLDESVAALRPARSHRQGMQRIHLRLNTGSCVPDTVYKDLLMKRPVSSTAG